MTLSPFRFASRRILLVGRIVLTVVFVAYVYRRVNWSGLEDSLRLADPGKLAVAVCLQGCVIAVAAARWQTLLANQGIQLSWRQAARLTLIGLFFNLLFLGSVGGDTARFAGTLGHAADRKARLALSLVQDRLIGLGALLLLVSGFIGLQCPRIWAEPALRPLALGVPVACGAYFIVVVVLWVLDGSGVSADGNKPRRWRDLGLKAIRMSFPKHVFLPAMGLSLLIHTLVLVAGYLTAHAVGIKISFSGIGIVLGITFLALSLPVTVAGLGVRDGMLLWLLFAFGFKSTAAAISLSTCLLGINLWWAFVGAVTFYCKGPREDPPP
jgi:glycosyltransferase 2 family protein